ncbi:MAG: hypothetical protein R3Y63_03480 [Eubacteriales bacterium]
MLKLFEQINPTYCYLLFAFLLSVGIFSLIYYKKSKDSIFLFNGLISFGLCYDTIITGLGYHLVNVSGFYWIGIFRHVFHALTPLIMMIVLNAFRDCGKLLHKNYTKLVWVLVFFLSGGAIVAIFTSPVDLIDYGGVIRHSIDKDNAFFLSRFILKFLSYGTLIPMSAGAIVTIRYKKDYNMLISTLGMLGFTLVGVIFDPKLIFLSSFLGEAILVFFYFRYAYQKFQDTNLGKDAPEELI